MKANSLRMRRAGGRNGERVRSNHRRELVREEGGNGLLVRRRLVLRRRIRTVTGNLRVLDARWSRRRTVTPTAGGLSKRRRPPRSVAVLVERRHAGFRTEKLGR